MVSARERRRRMIGVSFGPRTMAEALEGLPRIAAEADIAELRLDFFEEPFDLPTLLRDRPCPVVVTLRPTDQGGKSSQPTAERLNVLQRAADLGAEYVDVEWDAASPDAIRALKEAGAQVLVSRHDFQQMPPDFAECWWPDMVERGADVVKIVGMARSAIDCLQVFRAFKRANLPTVAIAMGEAGLPTRVLALREGQCFLTYATLGSGARVAPGQLPIREMREVYRVDRLGTDTRVIGLLGPTVDSDLADRHNAAFAAASLDAVAVPFVVGSDVAEVVRAFRELPVAGWQVSGDEPQASIGATLDDLGQGARRTGRVNTILARGDGALVGDWLDSPDEQHAAWGISCAMRDAHNANGP